MSDFQYKALNLAINTDAMSKADARAFKLLRILQAAPDNTLDTQRVNKVLETHPVTLNMVVDRANCISKIHRIDRPRGKLVLRRRDGK
jgi:hypothetical protein